MSVEWRARKYYLLFECGSCGSYHLPLQDELHEREVYDTANDCRDDNNRYANKEDFCEREQIPEDQVVEIAAEYNEDGSGEFVGEDGESYGRWDTDGFPIGEDKEVTDG